MSAFTAKARCGCVLSPYAVMESRLVLIAEGYFAFNLAFNRLEQFGDKTKKQ